MPSLPHEQMVMEMSMPPANSSTDTAMQPPMHMNSSSDTPPRATSTPMRTFQMSAHINMHSSEFNSSDFMNRRGVYVIRPLGSGFRDAECFTGDGQL